MTIQTARLVAEAEAAVSGDFRRFRAASVLNWPIYSSDGPHPSKARERSSTNTPDASTIFEGLALLSMNWNSIAESLKD